MKNIKTFGAEIEKAIANINTAQSQSASQQFFKKLKQAAAKRGVKNHYHFSDIQPRTILGVISDDLGEQGLDNGFNLLETALPYQTSLSNLYQKMQIDLKTTQEALQKEGATIINLSIHPLGKRDSKTYKKFVAPKGIYQYITYRGWDHSAGIDAKAQNSPTTGVDIYQAADAVSAIIGCGAALIALFGNSPFEEGKKSKYKEVRLTMWDRMMGNSKSKGDWITSKFPPKRFRNLADYFNWMFGKGTQIHFVFARGNNHSGYKSIRDQILIPQGKLSVLDYLSKESWPAYWFKEIQKVNPNIEIITPNISDLEVLQFTQFAGARIRFKLKDHDNFPIKEFLDACKKGTNDVEKILSNFSEYFYIEGRDPGANFPDQEIQTAGNQTAQSVIVSPAALQAGLINNLNKVTEFIDSYPWKTLEILREAAIKNGLQGNVGKVKVMDFTKKVLNLAAEGLSKNEQWMLEYPRWVLKTKQNGADRAIKFVENYKGSFRNALKELVQSRQIIL